MFKLVKIEGAGTNQGEPIRIKTSPGTEYKYGYPYSLFDGFLIPSEAEMRPTHIVLENIGANEDKESVLCYRILDNMVFEVPVCTSFAKLTVGYKYTLATDDYGFPIGMTATTSNGVLMLHDLNGARKKGDTVYVRITTEASY